MFCLTRSPITQQNIHPNSISQYIQPRPLEQLQKLSSLQHCEFGTVYLYALCISF